MMEIIVQRHASRNGCTIGEMSIDGVFECFTLEDTVREVSGQPVSAWKIKGETAIPLGIYPVEITFSNRFQKETPILLNVPGFSGIRIHPGNTSADTEGCILVGQKVATDERNILQSRDAFKALFIKIQEELDDGKSVTIDIRGA